MKLPRVLALLLILTLSAFALAGCADKGETTTNASGWEEFNIKMSDGRKVPCVSNGYGTHSSTFAFDCDWDSAKRSSSDTSSSSEDE